MAEKRKQNKIEICAYSIDSCLVAERTGADRVELCDNQQEGGTTPSYATIVYAKEHLNIDTMVMIRPRGGDFLYNDIEFSLMKEDILLCKKIGVKGVVFGLLNSDGRIDKERTKTLIDIAKPLDVCFHRAIDVSKDYYQSVRDIISCGAKRILTSGAANKAIEGIENIKKIQQDFGSQIEIMIGSGVNSSNIKILKEYTNVNNFHLSAKTKIDSNMKFRHTVVSMGGNNLDEYSINIASEEEIKKVKERLSYKNLHDFCF